MSTQTAERPKSMRPFGLTKAVPVVPTTDETLHTLTLCPERQVSVTLDNEIFVHTPSMTTSTTSQTQYQTETDHQKWMDSDTAPTIDQ
ncbi:putative ATP-grasp-modified RiPP [Kitasatospora sp. CB01950]|uniref:putative ATP-grasp-modified RiPP n=1 Tax=Kitasatospora sp. CB01950 TaxID=1703930 RepID=UPI001F519C4F|nr:putative ATP-grasp-modified RiPP [Kitasatospora sp. CB01950]